MATSAALESFLTCLPALGFEKKGLMFTKSIGPARLTVDLKNEKLIYPEDQGLTISGGQPCNFDQLENFVVFECVHRLLVKGYAARHIELEPKWKVGHGSSGGRADILIKDNSDKALLIIECKTAGREFDRAWKNTLQDGDQLFSYAQQISETQFLCLYTTEFTDGIVRYQSHIIAHRDNEKYLADNPTFKGFKNATDVRSRFSVWRDTYKLDFTPSGIFEDIIQPYHIGKDKYSLADLHPISASDQQKKYHEFATILRQHNVSGRENAFDKLINLFLCKLVDETENPDDLKFYWKGVAYDTHFELLDRLQQLYQKGMGKFLGEDITYINESDVSNALRFIRQNPDATQRAVWNLFIQQKFFTNNDFSLIDVHNEKLFYQNAEVLLKILQMWQGIRLTGNEQHNQFLGDMFEFFLDQGVKQSEGQFFTPGPICRFLMMSLPLEALVKAMPTPPKAIDYACGAGHFLTELALQLKPIVGKHHPLKEISDYHAAIYGVEKEYRLSKIAKVSAFMYGQPGINICYGDALIPKHDSFPGIQNGTFDLLVANPPFSVKGFLETLPESERDAYLLTDTIDKLDTANSIETFFLERATQLLKPGGLAAIILPSSILSNGGNTYVRAREILLQSFDIVAIAEFGSGTFGKTGTNTVALFLRRKPTAPDSAEHYSERVDEWFKGSGNSKRKQDSYKDAHLMERYAAYRGIAAEDYKTLLSGSPNEPLLGHETFSAYRHAFDASTEIKNLKKQKKFRELKATAQEAELDKRFLAFIQSIERDKLLHFILADQQPNQVLILKCPTDNKEQKKFLGYEWSSAKGDEGIKLIKDAHGRHLTPLYDETDRDNVSKLNYAISQNFTSELKAIPIELERYLSLVYVPDLLDFSRPSFEKQIALSVKTSVTIQSKWPLVKLSEICSINPSKSEIRSLPAGTPVTFIEMSSVSENGTIVIRETRSIDDLRKGSFTYFGEGDILLAKITPCMENGKCALATGLSNGVGLGSSEFHVIRADQSKVLSGYLFVFLNRQEIRSVAAQNMTGSSGHRRVPEYFYSDLPIPVPPIPTQKAIMTECRAVAAEAEAAQATIEKAQQAMDSAVDAVYASNVSRAAIINLSLEVQYGLNEAMNEGGVGYKIFRMNEIFGGRMMDGGEMKCADISAEEFAKYRLNRGDVLFNRTNSIEHVGKTGLFDLEGDYCFASYLVRVVPDTKKIVPHFLTAMMNSTEFQAEAKSKAAKSINQANINATTMKNMSVPAPALSEQKSLVAKLESLEAEIASAKAVLANVPALRAAILRKYL